MPRPVCNPTTASPVIPAWKSILPGKLWGVAFDQAVRSIADGYLYPTTPLYCQIMPEIATISCGTANFEFVSVPAAIADDGTFSTDANAPRTLRGRVLADGNVVVEAFFEKKCVGTYCEKTKGTNLPKTNKAYELCRTPDHQLQGGWVAGRYLDCAKCNGQCEDGR